MAAVLLLSCAPALYADTQEWGHDVIRVESAQPAQLSVGPSGATMQSSSGATIQTSSGSSDRRARAHTRGGRRVIDDTPVSANYCVELAPSDASSGPYRLNFTFTSGDGTGASSVSVAFDLATNVDTWATTAGDASLAGALYDANGVLVAGDDGSGGRVSTSLPAGQYSLVLGGGAALAGTYVVTADQGSCGQ
jgi:hypothetical protein